MKFYYGRPSKGAVCRTSKAKLALFVREVAKYAPTAQWAEQVINEIVAQDEEECVDAKAKEFSTFTCMPTDDVRVMLQFQEELVYKCAKWKH